MTYQLFDQYYDSTICGVCALTFDFIILRWWWKRSRLMFRIGNVIFIPFIFIIAAYVKWKLEPYYWWLRFKVIKPAPLVKQEYEPFEE
jgi:hypothetical protein